MTSSVPAPEELAIPADLARSLAAAASTGQAAVTRVDLPSGPVIIKLHARLDRWAAEIHAYTTWAPAVAARTPQLLGVSNDPPAAILTAVPGQRLDQAQLEPEAEQAAHAQLGEFLGAFHTSAPALQGTGIAGWLAERGRQWLTRAAELIPNREQRSIARHLAELEQLGDLPAVPCHLDFTPSNVIVTPARTAIVIDFEHARYDLAARDLVRLHDRVWPARPDLASAFLATYGPLTDVDQEIIRHTTPLDRLTRRVRRSEAARLHP